MKKRIAGIGFAAVASLLVQTAATSMTLGGCSSDDNAAPDASDGSTDAVVDPCSLFTHSGDTCTIRTAIACFPECDIGGCFCLETSTPGVSRWVCHTDTTCIPDGSPIDDVQAQDVAVTPDDAGDDDAANDATPDSSDGAIGDASDAGANDANDAAVNDASFDGDAADGST